MTPKEGKAIFKRAIKSQVYYISDMHLDEKAGVLPDQDRPSTESIQSYCQSAVNKLSASIKPDLSNDIIFIFGGDISHDKEVILAFFQAFGKSMKQFKSEANQVFAFLVPGNHEKMIEDLPNTYSKLKKSGIIVLDRQIAINNGTSFEIKKLRETDNIFSEATEARRKKIIKEYGGRIFAILGTPFDDEILFPMMEIFDVTEKSLIIYVTHFESTLRLSRPGFFWIYGHTHRNYRNTAESTYADNQNWKISDDFKWKRLLFEPPSDPFASLEEGIHDITPKDLDQFYLFKNINAFASRQIGKLSLVKRDEYYMFFEQTNKSLFVLNGYSKKAAERPIEYYFNNLSGYIRLMKDFVSDYSKRLIDISAYIQKLGGIGKIHGAVIDVCDSLHIFVDPLENRTFRYSEIRSPQKEITVYQSFEEAINSLSKTRKEIKRKLSKAKHVMPIELDYLATANEIEWFKQLGLRKISIAIESFTNLQSKIIRTWNGEILSRPICEILQSMMGVNDEATN